VNESTYIKLSGKVGEHLPHLKGVRLSVFMALAFNEAGIAFSRRDALSVREIAARTDLTERSVLAAVQYLRVQHLVVQMPRRNGRGEKIYRVKKYVRCGDPAGISESSSPLPEYQDAEGMKQNADGVKQDAVRLKSDAVVVKVVNTPTESSSKEKTLTTAVSAGVRAILSEAGIWGDDLERLAATVTPERAERWALWVRWAKQEAKDRYASPAGLARFHLLRDPTREPDCICPIPEGFDPLSAPDHPQEEQPDPVPDDEEPLVEEQDAGGEFEAQEVWRSAVKELSLALAKETFEKWVRPTVGLLWDGDVLVVRVHSPYAKEWLERRLQTTVHRTLVGILGRSAEIRYETG
jgi:hypothetical protein